jgi:putative phosphoribosyl transferase
MRGFVDRRDAGRQLGARLALDRALRDVVVVGLPRGGMPVAEEVAEALTAPLDVLVVRKVGLPFQPEVAMGAIGEGGVVVAEEGVLRAVAVSAKEFANAAARERVELERRVRRYRGGRDLASLSGKTVVIVDDGIATGATTRAACAVARAAGAARVVLAVPVASSEAARGLRRDADEVVSLVLVDGSFSVGRWYEQFDQTSDEVVVECLERARRREEPATGDDSSVDEPFGTSGFGSDISGGVAWR